MFSGDSTVANINSNHPMALEEDRTCKHQARGGGTSVGTLIAALPDDMVLRIMVELPRSNWVNLRLVSKAWRNILRDPCFYQSRVALNLTEEWCYTEAWHPESKLVSWFAFDFSRGNWTALPPIPRKKGWDPEIFGRASTSLRGELYVLGGKAGVSGPTLREMFIYSPFTNRWRKGKSMITTRHSPLMWVPHFEHKIYVTGGFDFLNNAIATGECYNADTEEWTIMGNVDYPKLLCPSWYEVGWQVQWIEFYYANQFYIYYKTKESQQMGRYYVPGEGVWMSRDPRNKACSGALLRYSLGTIVDRNVVVLDWATGRLRYHFHPSRTDVGWATVRGMADLDWVTIFRNNPKASALGSKFVLVGRRLSIWLIETDPTLLEAENRNFIDSFLAQGDAPDLEALSCVTVVA